MNAKIKQISNNHIKKIRKLNQKKYREQEGLFIVEGEKMVDELLKSNFIVDSLYSDTPENYSKYEVDVYEVNKKQLEQISSLVTSEGIVALAKIPTVSILASNNTLILDGIKDPGNMGTMIRTADWFGISQIICINNCVDFYSPKVVRASMGSVFRVKLKKTDIEEIKDLKLNIYGAFLKGKPINDTEIKHPFGLVIGSESHGISDIINNEINHRVTIPQIGETESLNAAVACGILLDRMLV